MIIALGVMADLIPALIIAIAVAAVIGAAWMAVTAVRDCRQAQAQRTFDAHVGQAIANVTQEARQ